MRQSAGWNRSFLTHAKTQHQVMVTEARQVLQAAMAHIRMLHICFAPKQQKLQHYVNVLVRWKDWCTTWRHELSCLRRLMSPMTKRKKNNTDVEPGNELVPEIHHRIKGVVKPIKQRQKSMLGCTGWFNYQARSPPKRVTSRVWGTLVTCTCHHYLIRAASPLLSCLSWSWKSMEWGRTRCVWKFIERCTHCD